MVRLRNIWLPGLLMILLEAICVWIFIPAIFLSKKCLQVRLNDDNEEKLLPYAKLLNADFVWIYSSITVLEATLAYSLNNMGVPTLVVEMGVGHRINNAYCHQLIDGIFNMLIHMGIWEDEAPQVKQPIISTEGEVSIINAAQTGVFVAATDHMGAIEMGTHIGDIIEPIGRKGDSEN